MTTFINTLTKVVINPRQQDRRTKKLATEYNSGMATLPFPASDPRFGCSRCEMFVGYFKSLNGCYQQMAMIENGYYAHLDTHYTSKTHTGNGTYSGAFAFTLTKSPKDALSVGDMLTAVRKIMSQKSCPVARYAWYYEEKGRDENGDALHPHIHGIYETETGGRIPTRQWKRAWSIWNPNKPLAKGCEGFRGGYHRPVRSNEAYSDYIKKDGGMSENKDMELLPSMEA